MKKQLLIGSALLLALAGCGNKSDEKTNTKTPSTTTESVVTEKSTENQSQKSSETDALTNKEDYWVSNAKYTAKTSADSYQTEDGTTFYAKNIIVPYIDLDSEDAKTVNDELKTIYEDAISKYNQGVEDKKTYIEASEYSDCTTDNIGSLIYVYVPCENGTSTPIYYTYNFELFSGNLITFESLYNSKGYSAEYIDNDIKSTITAFVTEVLSGAEGNYSPDEYIEKSYNHYEQSLIDNNVKFFLDNAGNINVIVTIELPFGTGKIETPITITPLDENNTQENSDTEETTSNIDDKEENDTTTSSDNTSDEASEKE